MNQRTPLYQAHVEAGAKLVPFAGWDMPVNYGSQIREHQLVREDAGMFDVSHMTVIDVTGASSLAYLQRLLAADVARLSVGQAQYGALLNAAGGIIDDLIAYRTVDGFRLVTNAGTRQKVIRWFSVTKDLRLDNSPTFGLSSPSGRPGKGGDADRVQRGAGSAERDHGCPDPKGPFAIRFFRKAGHGVQRH